MIIFTQSSSSPLVVCRYAAGLRIFASCCQEAAITPPQMANSSPLSRTLASAKLTTRHNWVYYELRPTNMNTKVHLNSLLYVIAWVVISTNSGSLILFHESRMTWVGLDTHTHTFDNVKMCHF